MRYLSVCSGIEAATAAWKPLGWKPVAVAEIEPFCCAVLAHHHPDVPNLGDITKLTEADLERFTGTTDLLVGGTPCQSFSVAGLRKGMGDPRGNLALRFCQLAAAIRPRWVLWENVSGVLSSGSGRDFGAFLGALAELGYGFAYRVLDAQFVRVESHPFAVPQRRRRVFVVGCLGDWRRACQVLLERDSLCGYPPPRREAGKGVAAYACRSTQTSSNGWGIAREVTHTLDSTQNQAIAHFLRAEGFDASEDGTGRGTPLVFDTTQLTSAANRSHPKPGDPCHPLAEGAHPPAVAFTSKDHGQDAAEEVSPTLRAGQHDKSHANAGVPPAVAVQESKRDGVAEYDTAGSLRADAPGHQPCGTLARQAMQVRRLTPVECARLQGFQDDYLSQVTYRKRCPPADGPMYRALDNSMAVNVMRWIGERIREVEKLTR